MERLTLKGHEEMIWAAAFSPDGKTLATVSGLYNRPGELIFWDPVAGKQRARTREAKGIRRNILGDDRARSDVGAIAHAHGRDERGIAADENALADGRRVLVDAVVVASDGAGADVCAAADARIAQIGEVLGF